MRFIFICILILFYISCVYPNTVSVIGKVIDQNTGSPIEYACVFIANTTVGTYSDEKGEFSLSFSQDGVLCLVISHVSYETFIVNITADNDTLNVLVKLKTKTYELQSVNIIEDDPYRKDKIEAFSKGLMGQSKNSLRCRIINPSVLHLYGKKPHFFLENWNLKVSADSMLIINNEALGYKIKYRLIYFDLTFKRLIFYGYPLFENSVTAANNPSRIMQRRKVAYEGSKLHFFRSLYSHSLEEEGFEIYRIMAYEKDTDDPKYGLLGDSVFIGKSNVMLKQTKEQLNLYDYLTYDSISRSRKLNIIQPFEIRYIRRREEDNYNRYPNYFLGLKRSINAQTTIVKLKNNNIQFYSNGSFEKPDELITIGYWSYKQLADLLPYDYLPE
jgi:hypothetical protein